MKTHLSRSRIFSTSAVAAFALLALAGCSVRAGDRPTAKAPKHKAAAASPKPTPKKAVAANTPGQVTTMPPMEAPKPPAQEKLSESDEKQNEVSEPSAAAIATKVEKRAADEEFAFESVGEASSLVVPIRVPLEVLAERLDALLPKTFDQGWGLATKKGDSPAIETRYKAHRDPVSLSFSGDTLRVVVPVRFAANVRAKVKNPLGDGMMWLTENETWGTEARPQRIKLTIEIALGLGEDWALRTKSKLKKIEHGPAPEGDACTSGGLRVCTPKKSLTGQVNSEIDKQLKGKLEAALKKVDGELNKAASLKESVASVWTTLGTPHAIHKAKGKDCAPSSGPVCTKDLWLAFEPEAIAASPLVAHGDDIGLDVSLRGKLRTTSGAKPTASKTPLPKLEKMEEKGQFELKTSLTVPANLLAAQLSESLSGISVPVKSGQLSLSGAALALHSNDRVELTLSAKGAFQGPIQLKGKLSLDRNKALLSLSELALDEKTSALLAGELSGLDVPALLKKVEGVASVSLAGTPKWLEEVIHASLGERGTGHLLVEGKLSDSSVLGVTTKDNVAHVEIDLRGNLHVGLSK